MRENDIVPGIKVDKGVQILPGAKAGETATMGLDSLAKMASDYYAIGCRFAKWRAVLRIGKDLPTN